MRRREFLGVIGGVAVAWPFVARAQPSRGVRLIGVLMGIGEDDPETHGHASKPSSKVCGSEVGMKAATCTWNTVGRRATLS